MSSIESISKKLVLLSLPHDQLPDEKRDEINRERQKIARLMIGRTWVNGDGIPTRNRRRRTSSLLPRGKTQMLDEGGDRGE